MKQFWEVGRDIFVNNKEGAIMDKITFKGGSLDEAIDGAAKVLGISKDEMGHRVLDEGKSAMLGIIGGKETEIEAWKKVPLDEEARDMMQEMLNKMHLLAVAEAKIGEQGEVLVEVKGEDLGQIIGKDGATLTSLQIVISTALSRRHACRVRVYVDAGGYKEKQAQAIERIANSAAKDVESTGEEKFLPPMSPAERRIVHMALRDNPNVTTHSEGEGKERRLVISPKK